MRPASLLALTVALWAAGARDPQNIGPAGPPLPAHDAFLEKTREKVAEGERAFYARSRMERSTELRLNPFAHMGTGPTVLAEVFPMADEELTYRRILERDGRRATDLPEQDRKYRQKYEEWHRERADESPRARAARLKADADQRARQEVFVRETLDLFTFDLEGRGTWEGEPVILVRFAPKPEGTPRTREARIARAFSGRAWVHEFEHEVMHMEAKANDDVSLGFGLIARLHKGAAVQFTKRKLAGVWLPTETAFQGTGRALMFRFIEIDFRREYFDYRPFDPADLPARLGWVR